MKKPPKVLNRITDAVLAYHPKPKSKPAKKRARRKKKVIRERVVIVGTRSPVECVIREYVYK